MISFLIQGLFFTVAYYEPLKPLRKMLGLHCDGFNCWGMGVVYALLMLVVIPIIILIIGHFLAKERKMIMSVQAFGIALLVAIVLIIFRNI